MEPREIARFILNNIYRISPERPWDEDIIETLTKVERVKGGFRIVSSTLPNHWVEMTWYDRQVYWITAHFEDGGKESSISTWCYNALCEFDEGCRAIPRG